MLMPGIQGVVPAVWGAVWNPFIDAGANPNGEFCTYGDKHVKLWRHKEVGA